MEQDQKTVVVTYCFTYRVAKQPHKVRQQRFEGPRRWMHPSYKTVLREVAISIAVGTIIGETLSVSLRDVDKVQALRKEIMVENLWCDIDNQDLLA